METDRLPDGDAHHIVGRIIARHAPAGWRKAWITAIADDGYIGELTSDFIDAAGRTHPLDIPDAAEDFALAKALHSLRDTMPGDRKFTTCTFTLSPDSTFKFDVGYDD